MANVRHVAQIFQKTEMESLLPTSLAETFHPFILLLLIHTL